MATAEEKQVQQNVRDIARASIVQGQQRLATVGKAAAAFPARRLRSSGDMSRYAIGGFLSDALPPIEQPAPAPAPSSKATATAPKAKPPARPKASLPPIKLGQQTFKVKNTGAGPSAWYQS